MENLVPILFVVAIFAIFYFLTVRPQQKQRKVHEEMTRELKKGDKVITSSGIYGQIKRVDAETVSLEVESGATMMVAKGNILSKVNSAGSL
jgi:preprotein translocase subunit YajC